MRQVLYHPAARAEFLHEVTYYAAVSARLAEHFVAAVKRAEAQASEAPDACPAHHQGTRRVIDRRFKFALVFVHDDREVRVVALAHTRRRPGYWRARLPSDPESGASAED